MKIRIHRIRTKHVLIAPAFICTWLCFGFNTANPDYLTYESIYYAQGGPTLEFGFTSLCKIFNLLGFSFLTFRAAVALIGLLIIIKCIYDYTSSPVFTFFAYILYPFLFDVVQIRFFLAEVIILYSLRFLKEFNRKNLICFTFSLFLAISMHSISIAYCALYIAYFKHIKTVSKVSVALTTLLIVVRILGLSYFALMIRSMSFMGENFVTGAAYLNNMGTTYRLMIIYLLIDILMLILYYHSHRDISAAGSYREQIACHTGLQMSFEVSIKLILISMIFTPLFAYGSSFGRLFRGMLILLYCIGLNGHAIQGRILKVRSIIPKVYVACLSVVLFYAHIVTGDSDVFNRVLKMVLDNNLLFL